MKRGDFRVGERFFWSVLRWCLHRAQVIHVPMGFTGQSGFLCSLI